MRGVLRARAAISFAAAGSMRVCRIAAERVTIRVSSSVV